MYLEAVNFFLRANVKIYTIFGFMILWPATYYNEKEFEAVVISMNDL